MLPTPRVVPQWLTFGTQTSALAGRGSAWPSSQFPSPLTAALRCSVDRDEGHMAVLRPHASHQLTALVSSSTQTGDVVSICPCPSPGDTGHDNPLQMAPFPTTVMAHTCAVWTLVSPPLVTLSVKWAPDGSALCIPRPA